MSTLYLAWREPGRRWWPVGQLTHTEKEYRFAYTQGARNAQTAGFRPISSFPQFDEIYVSAELFPLFANRLPPKSRPDYQEFVECLALGPGETDPMALLARSGGRRETDMFEVFHTPRRNETGLYETSFFVHGIRHDPAAEKEASNLRPGDLLNLKEEPDNAQDSRAVQVLVSASGTRLGYVPRYLCEDVHSLKERNTGPLEVRVKRVNVAPVPAQFRVLCTLTSSWPEGFTSLSAPDFEVIRK